MSVLPASNPQAAILKRPPPLIPGSEGWPSACDVSPALAPILLATLALLAAACGSVFGSGSTATLHRNVVPPTATPEPPDLTVFRGFIYPIRGACLPEGDQLMPNAPREYRGGTHEGVDFYDYDNCTDDRRGHRHRRCEGRRGDPR